MVTDHYASGEEPQKGDLIEYDGREEATRQPVERLFHLIEARHLWEVMTVTEDMVRAKAVDAPVWRQAFFTREMRLAHRNTSP